VWEEEPQIGRKFQGQKVASGWLHFDCEAPNPKHVITDDKVYQQERNWPEDGRKDSSWDDHLLSR
jgi:hypothetical protein